MPTLLMHFPGGRYHATPWGHHVNEGLVEWPPSPWRLLRALIACGYATQGWTEVPPVGRRLIEGLAGTLPTYLLPAGALAHSRHFMPMGVLDKGREKTTLVFDSWADVGTDALLVRWDCSLGPDAQSLFERLATHLGYLGRSESWVVAESVSDDPARFREPDAFPHVDGLHGERGWEQVSLMAAEPPASFGEWRRQAVDAALAPFPLPSGKKVVTAKLMKDRAQAEAPFPADVINCLQKDTAWWKDHHWSQPPGSRRILYWRRTEALSVVPSPRVVSHDPGRVAMMLLALTTPSGRLSALPRRTRTLPQAELVHRALVARTSRGVRTDCPELTGRGSDRKPLTGHRHAHILPVDLDGDGYLDHILIYAKMGLGPAAQWALRTLERTWTKGGVGELQVALAGQGDLDHLRTLPATLARGVAQLLGPEAGCRVWCSATPFVAPRFQKSRGANTLEGQVNAELASRGLPAATVEFLPWTDQTREMRHAVRVRRYPASPPPVDIGYAVRVSFDTPVSGPLTLGYGSHFGLGLFQAESDG